MDFPLVLQIDVAAFAVAGLLTVSTAVVRRSHLQTSQFSPEKSTYQDKDGVANEKTQAAYSTRIQSALSILSISIGFALALTHAILQTLVQTDSRLKQSWLLVAIWVFAALQRIQIITTRGPVAKFQLCGLEALTLIAAAAPSILPLYDLSQANKIHKRSQIPLAMFAGNLAVAVIGFFVDICVPRRPAVFKAGRPADAQWTYSMFTRYCYAWSNDLLKLSAGGHQLQADDLPALDHHSRAENLHDQYQETADQYQGGMVKLLFLTHWRSFLAQYLWTAVDAVCLVLPQYAMYNLLRLLEKRDQGQEIAARATFWVVALGGFCFLEAFTSNAMWWINYSNFGVRWRAQLSALIYTKATRKKNVQGVAKKAKKIIAAINLDGEEAVKIDLPVANVEKEAEDESDNVEDNLQKSKQGVINLLGVDAARVTNFAVMNFMFLGSVARLLLSFTFLGLLVGPIPLFSGIAVQLLFLPANIYFSKKYTAGQEVLMKVRDKKLATLNEALGGMRQIKFSALERQWLKKISDVREDELTALWKTFIFDTVLIGLWLMGPVVLSATVITVYALREGGLPASVAFTTISILGQIEGTLSYIPELTTNMLDAYVSLKRIADYLNTPEKQLSSQPGSEIAFKDVSLTWPSDDKKEGDEEGENERFALRNLNINFPKGELSVISGRTGTGKSLLLNAILGEIDLLAGTITIPTAPPAADRHDDKANKSNWIIPEAVAFVSQQPWIENTSFKNNILFGLPLDEQRYKRVIAACSLDKDLEVMPDGDRQEIGAQGINLSGGQRWRITLGRALYSRAGTLIMDDIFSAVDAHVGKHIFEEALTGPLCKGRTRILVTHHVSLVLAATKYEVRLANGTVEYAGSVEELQRNGELDEVLEEEDDIVDGASLAPTASRQSRRRSSARRLSKSNGSVLSKRRESGTSVRSQLIDDGGIAAKSKDAPKKFVEDEKAEVGKVKFRIYKAYLQAGGGLFFWFTVALAFACYQALLLARSWVLKSWTQGYEEQDANAWYAHTNVFSLQKAHPTTLISTTSDRHDQSNQDLKFYLGLYLGLAAVICLEGTFRYLYVFYGSIKASRQLFDALARAVLRAPLRWLDTVPVGRILNRFTGDFQQLDGMQAYAIGFSFYNVMTVLGVVVAAAVVSPYVIICAVLLFLACGYFAIYYISGARDTKRLDSVGKSPIFDHFSATLAGVGTIRAFQKEAVYIEKMYERIDTYARAVYYQAVCSRWLSWRLGVVGAIFTTVVAGIVVGVKGMNAALGGFALGFTLQYAEAITFTLRNISYVELGMNAVERVIEYSDITTEDEGGADAPAHWPSEGRLSVDELVVGYAPDLPPVLKGLSFDVQAKERIGVVGRTGAGKSSLTLALFRFLEARSGSVHIDGLDISKIKLHDLRSRLAIIPQDPVLFSGTIRSNLDPFDEHTDKELQDALERVHLVDSPIDTVEVAKPYSAEEVSSEEEGNSGSDNGEGSSSSATATPRPSTKSKNEALTLKTAVAESGNNLSQGQRQLLCLARAIVSRPKIMVLDEATSAVDKVTDTLIQRSIRQEFSESTLIVIAHRLSTIADFDRILVMSDGKAAEFGTPKELYQIHDGIFKGMVGSSGEEEVLRGIILGEDEETNTKAT